MRVSLQFLTRVASYVSGGMGLGALALTVFDPATSTLVIGTAGASVAGALALWRHAQFTAVRQAQIEELHATYKSVLDDLASRHAAELIACRARADRLQAELDACREARYHPGPEKGPTP